MALDRFLIAPISEGLERDVKPWLIPESAFAQMNNAYVFRGRVKNRVGSINVGAFGDTSNITSRLRINLGKTNGAGTLASTVPGGAASIGAIGQMFSIGSELFTVVTAGAADMITTSPTATVYTYNTATGAFDIQTSLATTDVYFYPAKPVMGFTNFEKADINNENTYAFDTFFAYQLLVTGWERLATGGAAAQWSGTDSQFFWSCSWRGTDDYSYMLFTTNYNVTDGLRYFDGTTWTSWAPQYASNAADTILSARIIIPFQNRLILLNTIEKYNVGPVTNTFVNRCRYSRIGSPIAANSFREDIGGEGNFIDAPTREAIVSAAVLKNRLIVYFERSTYELVYTGNQVYPFRWQEINSTLGCESTFSIVSFDKTVLGIGQTGIHACTGANVQRIDTKIPDEVFELRNDDTGIYRVHGIRDYYNEMVYWAVPNETRAQTQKYPTKILAFNYAENAWAYFDDIITTFGYHQPSTDLTWAEVYKDWENYNAEWNDGEVHAEHRYVIAGNQQGFTFIMHREFEYNAYSQQITNITEAGGVITITSVNHNLKSGDWININSAGGTPELDENNYKVKVSAVNTFTIDDPPIFTGPYTGGGTFRLVSKVDLKSKRLNFYSKQAQGTNIQRADFLIDKNDNGQLTIDYMSSSSPLSMREAGLASGSILGTAILSSDAENTLEGSQERFWHRVYMQAQGESVQLRIYWNDEQMKDPYITTVGFEIHGILFFASPIHQI